jgi:Flp pilus assembly protein TadD
VSKLGRNSGYHWLLASAYQELGDNAAAVGALEAGLRRKPEDPKMLRALAYVQFQRKDDAAATRALEKYLEIEPEDAAARMDLALLFQRNEELSR